MMRDDDESRRTDRGRSQPSARQSKIDPTEIGKVAYTIDAYRSHVFYDFSWIDRKAQQGNLGRPFADDWKSVQLKMYKMARITVKIPGARRLAKIQSYVEAMWQILVPVAFIILFASLLAPGIGMIQQIAPYMIFVALGSLLTGLVSRSILGARIASKIDAYFRENPEAQKLRSGDLRETVQMLIEELRQYLLQTGEEPEKHMVGLGCIDYDHIEVVKKPRPWRRYYVVKVTL